MHNIRHSSMIILFLFLFSEIGCQDQKQDQRIDPGVSQQLAKERRDRISELTYKMSFEIYKEQDSLICAEVEIGFRLSESGSVVLDFKESSDKIQDVKLDNDPIAWHFINEHLILEAVDTGIHRVKIRFIAGEESLNRRDEFLYTLLVPDRARTLFPCFDQPDLKGKYQLSLVIPEQWIGIGNGAAVLDTVILHRRYLKFEETEPLSSYLFSFVAGELKESREVRAGREIKLYHRENDPHRLKQIPEIFDQVYMSLDWLETYTEIPYPFTKYDLILLPGFQYGGMEHTGATLYNDKQLFLPSNSTQTQELRRMKLIAHETAHMWFGDYVTMEWFDEVWLKEVFANYFAAKITEPYFSNVNHPLNYLRTFFPAAYSEDRTQGATAILQQLPNLKDAGLIYGNTIYNKTPIVMNMLVDRIGEATFRKGIQHYLKQYGYGNATWNHLITILDELSQEDLRSWSKQWVEQKGRPQMTLFRDSEKSVTLATDWEVLPNRWKQPLSLLVIDTIHPAQMRYLQIDIQDDSCTIEITPTEVIIPNSNGRAYGYWRLDNESYAWGMRNLPNLKDEVTRLSFLINLYEGVMKEDVEETLFLDALVNYLPYEQNNLIYTTAMGYLKQVAWAILPLDEQREEALWKIVTDEQRKEFKQVAMDTYSALFASSKGTERMMALWSQRDSIPGLQLNEHNYINMAYQLAIRIPTRYHELLTKQLERIKNEDRRREFSYIMRAAHPDLKQRDSLFNQFLEPCERTIEPWCSAALQLLNHPLRRSDAIKYIYPALEELLEIQQTGDIFFPKNWIESVLQGHRGERAAQEVTAFFADHPDYPFLMKNKVLQSSHHLKTKIALQ